MRVPFLLTVALVAVSACAPDTLPEPRRPPVRESRPFDFTPRPPCDPALIAAVEKGRTEEIRRLAASGARVTCGTQEDPTLLSDAIHRDSPELVRALLEAGADPNARWTRWGDRLPLQDAIEADQFGHPSLHQVEIVRLLLEHGADANARWCPFESRHDPFGTHTLTCVSEEGRTPLAAAVWIGNAEIVAMLLDAGASATAAEWTGLTPLENLHDASVASVLLPRAFPEEATRGMSALQAMGDCKGCLWSPTNGTPLGRALTEWQTVIPPPPPPPQPPCPPGKARECRADEKASRQWSEREGRRVERRAADRVSIILDLGADPNERFTLAEVDWPPIALASGGALKALLEHGATVDSRWCVPVTDWSYNVKQFSPMPGCAIERGMTRLMTAAAAGSPEDVKVLLAHGADATLTDWEGRTAADYARTAGHPGVVALFRATRTSSVGK